MTTKAKPTATKNKFSNCFIDQRDDYEYDIIIDDEVFARAKTLSAKDNAAIEKEARAEVRSIGSNSSEVTVRVSNHDIMIATIYYALKSWQAGRQITKDSIAHLEPKMALEIFRQIREHENNLLETVEDNEKN